MVIALFLLPSSVFADKSTETLMPPISGWNSVQWGMTRGQFQKSSGRHLEPTKHSGYYSAGTSYFYGYPANLTINFDDAGALSGINFLMWSQTGVEALDTLYKLHGRLEAELGVPSLDGIGKNSDDGFNTLWCAKNWSVFLAPLVKYQQSKPTGVSVGYSHKDVCEKK